MKQINWERKKKYISYTLFIIGYFLVCVTFFMRRVTFIEEYLKLIKLLSMVILAFNCMLFIRSYTKKDFLIIALGGILSTIVYYYSKDNSFIVLVLCIFSSKNIKINDVIKIDLLAKILITVLLLAFSNLGLTDEHIFYREGIKRFSFGFSHPNKFAFILSTILIEMLYLYYDKRKYFLLLPIIGAMYIIYQYADSRAAMCLLVGITIFFVFEKKITILFNNKFVRFFIRHSFVIITIFTLFITLLYYKNTTIGIKANKILSNRLKYNVEFLEHYHVNLFGNELDLVSSEESHLLNETPHILDNSFTRLLLQYGAIIYVIFYYLLYKSFCYALELKNNRLIAILLCYIIYGMVEAGIYVITFNIFLIYFRVFMISSEDSGASVKLIKPIEILSKIRRKDATK